MKVLLLFSLYLIQLDAKLLANTKAKVVCYWAQWEPHQSPDQRHTPEDIDANLCTHILYEWIYLDERTDSVNDTDQYGPHIDVYKRLVSLKKKNPELKIIASLNGLSQSFSNLIPNQTRRQELIQNTIKYLKQYHFDGLDFDWEFPVCWDGDCSKGVKTDRQFFATLVKVSIKRIFIRDT